MTVARFCTKYPYGLFIVRVAKHMLAVWDGVMYDTVAERGNRCVYCARAFRSKGLYTGISSLQRGL